MRHAILKKASICRCGYPLMDVPLGTEYRVFTELKDRASFVCGGCHRTRDVIAVMAHRDGTWPGTVPMDALELLRVDERDCPPHESRVIVGEWKDLDLFRAKDFEDAPHLLLVNHKTRFRIGGHIRVAPVEGMDIDPITRKWYAFDPNYKPRWMEGIIWKMEHVWTYLFRLP